MLRIRRLRSALVWAGLRCALVLALPAACSTSDDGSLPFNPGPPTAPAPVPANNLVLEGIVPVAGRPEEHTNVRLFGGGFRPGLTVTFDGIASPATVDGNWIVTSAPPHRAGAIDVVVTNPDGRTHRREKVFTYVEGLLPSGDISMGPADSVTATLGNTDRSCGLDDLPCRRLFIRAPPDQVVEVELVSSNGGVNIGLFDPMPFWEPSHYPKQLTVRGGQQVWVVGEWALFSLTTRVAK